MKCLICEENDVSPKLDALCTECFMTSVNHVKKIMHNMTPKNRLEFATELLWMVAEELEKG